MERRLIIARAALNRFQLRYDMFMALLKEMREFAKRKQDGILSPVKVEMINRRLDELRDILKDDEIFSFLEKLDSDRLPSNSDVVLVLSQYEVALESHARGRYIGKESGPHQKRWTVAKNFLKSMTTISTSPDTSTGSDISQPLTGVDRKGLLDEQSS